MEKTITRKTWCKQTTQKSTIIGKQRSQFMKTPLVIVLTSFILVSSTSFAEEVIPAGWAKYIQDKKSAEQTAAKTPVASEKKVKTAHHKKKALADRIPAGERSKLVPNSNPSAVRPSQTDSPVNESPQEEETRITGNWGGARTKLSDSGVDIGFVYKGDFTRNFSGGIDQHSDYLGNIDFKTSFNFEKLVGWKGGSAFFYALHNHGGHPTQHVGDAGSTHNIETKISATKVYEAWIQQLAFDDKVSFLVGLHDLNSEFYVTDASGLFLNSSFGVGAEIAQTGVNGPSIFPTTSTAIRVRAEPSKNFYIQTALFDAQAGDPNNLTASYFRVNGSDGQLAITEFALFSGKENPKDLYGKIGAGVWNYSRTFDRLAGGDKGTNHGWYVLGEQWITSEIALFLRYGTADGEVNRFANCLTTGVTFNGLLGRPKDRFGLGYARIAQSDDYIQSVVAGGGDTLSSESAFEFSYRYELIPGVALQPDVQYVMHPGMNPALNNAVTSSMRVELNF
jgi:porin